MKSKALNEEEQIIEAALSILKKRIKTLDYAGSPSAVQNYLKLLLAGKEHEVFMVLMLDTQNRVITCEEMFRGTLTQASVYPREIVKSALAVNAASVILAHNHPSACASPSFQDQSLTMQLKSALALVDIKVLDHIILAGDEAVSFVEKGLM